MGSYLKFGIYIHQDDSNVLSQTWCNGFYMQGLKQKKKKKKKKSANMTKMLILEGRLTASTLFDKS